MKKIVVIIAALVFASSGLAESSYHGVYSVENLEIRYTIPDYLIGPRYFTFIRTKANDPSDLTVFVTSYRKHFFSDLPEAGGVSIMLDTFPKYWGGKRDLAAYARDYQKADAYDHLRLGVDKVVISAVAWVRIQEWFPNGNRARIIYATPILPNYQSVCVIGFIDDLHQDERAPWKKWLPAFDGVMKSISIVDMRTGQRPANLGLVDSDVDKAGKPTVSGGIPTGSGRNGTK